MSDYGVVTEVGTVRFERVLPGPIERVWEFLTDPTQRSKWFAGGEIEPRVGGKVDFLFKHSNLMSEPEPVPEKYKDVVEKGMTFPCKVTRWEPPRTLAFTWGGPKDGMPPSEVTFELKPEGKSVRLMLTHQRLMSREGMLDISGGWHVHLDILAAKLEGRVQPPLWATLAKLNAVYQERTPKMPEGRAGGTDMPHERHP